MGVDGIGEAGRGQAACHSRTQDQPQATSPSSYRWSKEKKPCLLGRPNIFKPIQICQATLRRERDRTASAHLNGLYGSDPVRHACSSCR